MQNGGFGDPLSDRDCGLTQNAERPLGIKPADPVLLEQPGDYLWGADTNLGPDGFRPLRGTSANPALIDAA